MIPTRSKIDVPIYQIKVTLRNSKPPIWRRILVRSDVTLGQLHHILQNVMDWESYHLHQFIVGRTYYGEPHPDYGSDMRDESRVRLNQIVTGEKFQYRNKTINGTGIHSCLLALCCCSSGGPHSPTPTPIRRISSQCGIITPMSADRPADKDELISLAEAAKRYGFNQRYLSNLAKRGRLKAVKIARNWLTTPANMEEYIRSRQRRGRYRNDIQT